MLQHHPITDKEKQLICNWKYEGEYSIYDLPSYDQMQKNGLGFANPEKEKNFDSYFDGEVLVGFTNLLEEETEVFIGIGVNPDCCSRGYGQRILRIASQISAERYPGKPLYLEVRTWNERAVRCYQKAGFVIEGDCIEQETFLGESQFYRMVKPNETSGG